MTRYLISLLSLSLSLVSSFAEPPEPELRIGTEGFYEIHWPEPADRNYYTAM